MTRNSGEGIWTSTDFGKAVSHAALAQSEIEMDLLVPIEVFELKERVEGRASNMALESCRKKRERRASAGHTRTGMVELCSMFVATLQNEQLLSSHSVLCWQVQQRPSEDDAIRKALQDECNVRSARQWNVLHMRC